MLRKSELKFPFNIQMFAEGGDGGSGGSGDSGNSGNSGGSGGGNDYIAPSQAEYEKIQRDLHFYKSEHGNLKKSVGDLQSKIEEFESSGKSDLDKLTGKLSKTEEALATEKLAGLKKIALYEGKIAGLSEGDVLEIPISLEDTAEAIEKKVKDKKESLDQRFIQWAKEQGFQSSVLGNGGNGIGDGDNNKTHAEKWNKSKKETKKYYDV